MDSALELPRKTHTIRHRFQQTILVLEFPAQAMHIIHRQLARMEFTLELIRIIRQLTLELALILQVMEDIQSRSRTLFRFPKLQSLQ